MTSSALVVVKLGVTHEGVMSVPLAHTSKLLDVATPLCCSTPMVGYCTMASGKVAVTTSEALPLTFCAYHIATRVEPGDIIEQLPSSVKLLPAVSLSVGSTPLPNGNHDIATTRCRPAVTESDGAIVEPTLLPLESKLMTPET